MQLSLLQFLKPFVKPRARRFLRSTQDFLVHSPRDFSNLTRFGLSGLNIARRIYIDPSRVSLSSTAGFGRKKSGLIISGDWDLQIQPLAEIKKIAIVYDWFDTGRSWQECGAFAHMEELMQTRPGVDGCFTSEDVVQRYVRLTELINHLRQGGKYLRGSGFRETNGVFIHIGRNGELLFGGGGCHRLAIAQKLDLPLIPAHLGVVHSHFVRDHPEKMKFLKESSPSF